MYTRVQLAKSIDKATEFIDKIVLGMVPLLVLLGVFLLIIFYLQEILQLLSENVLGASALVALFSVSISSLVVAREYSLKVKAEKRLTESTQTESDARLSTLFTELIRIADGRGGDFYESERVVEELFKREIITEKDLEQVKKEKNIGSKLQYAVLEPVTGIVVQDVAMAAMLVLAQRHDNMKDIAKKAFGSMVTHQFKEDQAKKYLDLLEH
jgi:hypothetical protein